MIKVKDGYAKLIGTTYLGSANRVLLSNGGDHVLGNALNNIPLSNKILNIGLNSELFNNYSYDQFEGYFHTVIDAGKLDSNTWYPVTMKLPNSKQIRIKVEGLSYSETASWNPREDKGLVVILDYTTNGSEWGWSLVNRVVWRMTFGSGTGLGSSNCLAGLGQLTNSSTEYIFVRGGSSYHFYLSQDIKPILRTETYTVTNQSISPTTSQPPVIKRTNAHIEDITNSYWANIKISDTPNEATSPTFYTMTATSSVHTPLIYSNTELKLVTTNSPLYFKYNDDDTKSVILNGSAFKPYTTANKNIDLGADDSRWNRLYANSGNFSGNVIVKGSLNIGSNNIRNYIAFHGTTGDNPGEYNHTYIGENIYDGTENSELVLFKGNDYNHDRIRYLAASHHLFLVANDTHIGGTSFESIVNNTNTKDILKLTSTEITASVPIVGNLLGFASKAYFLLANNELEFGKLGLLYFNVLGTAGNDANANSTPTSHWYHIIRMNHGNNAGYFVDLAASLNNNNGFYWRQISNGVPKGWYRLLDTNNYKDILNNTYRPRINLGSIQDFEYKVIALHPLTNTNAHADYYSYGEIYAKRVNGLYPSYFIRYSSSKRYNTENPDISISSLGGNSKLCTFTYLGVKYVGILIRYGGGAQFNKIIYISGYWSHAPFIIKYFTELHGDVASSIDNEEVYNSIDFNVTNVPLYGNFYSSSNIEAKGFLKAGSNDLFVLLGGGGHKLISELIPTNYYWANIPISNVPNSDTEPTFNKVRSTAVYAGKSYLGPSHIELYGTGEKSTPFIDFHYGDTDTDYTNRIIEGLEGLLTVTGKLRIGLSYLVSTNYLFHVEGTSWLKGYTRIDGGALIARDSAIDLNTVNTIANDTNRWNNSSVVSNLLLKNANNALSIIVGGIANLRQALIQVGHGDAPYANYLGTLYLNKLGGSVVAGSIFSNCDLRFNYGLAYYNSTIQTETGTIVITLPNGFNSSMNTYEIDIYEYTGMDGTKNNVQHSKIIVSGYNFGDNPTWICCGYLQLGSYHKGVRLGYDGSKCCILLGTTTTTWSYPQVHLSRVITGFVGATTWSGNYSIKIITDESSYSKLVYVSRTKSVFGNIDAYNLVNADSFTSRVATGTLPYACTSTTLNTNLNADLLDGLHASDFIRTVKGIKNTEGTSYIKLGKIPVSANGTYDSFIIKGTIGIWGSKEKSYINIFVGGRNGITFKGLVLSKYSGWDIGVNAEREIFLIFSMTYAEWSLGLLAHQSTIDYGSDTPTDTNWTLLSNSSNIIWCDDLGAVNTATNGIFYIEGTGTTAGTWLGSHTLITLYYKGLTIAYKIPIAGAATTTLNINSLGAKTVLRNTGNLTTHLPVGTTVILVYDGSYFRWADYNDGNNRVNQYITNTADTEYPLLFRYATGAANSSGYVNEYTRYNSAITINPSTNTITTPGIVKTGNLVITETTNAKHILFSRGSDTKYPYNYIAAPAGGYICILPNGVESSSASGMQFSSDGLHPATNVAYSLGTSSLKWNAVYATNFHGALKGNADSASKLTTARTLTVGNLAKTFDGLTDVSWPLYDILLSSTLIGVSTSWNITTPGVYKVGADEAFTGAGNPESINGGGLPYRWGQLIVSKSGAGLALFYISHYDSNNKSYGIKYRTGYSNTYVDTWARILDSTNYNAYSPTLNGTGASGTWSINIKGSATKLTTVSKTAWGKTYWTNGGVPASISGDMTDVGNIWIPAGSTDKYITFTSSTSNVDGTLSWRIGYLGTGSGDGNYFVLQSTRTTTNTWTNALSITNEGLVATFASTVIAPKFLGKLAYTYLTGSGTTANLAIVSTGTADGWTLKTLGSRAFDSTNYLPLTGGTMDDGAIIKFNNKGGLRQTTDTTSNATTIILWYKGTDKDSNYSYAAQIGWHNTGDTDGAIYLVPNPQNLDPWGGSVGLYIGKTLFKWNNKTILYSGNTYISNGTITINGTNITPLTAHQSLANYVTLNTDLTITGSKTFTASTNTFSGTGANMLTIDRNSTNPAWIRFCKNGTLQGYIGISNDYNPLFLSGESGASNKVILHSGNYTSYLPFLNSSSTHATSSSTIYAPTSGGTSGLILKSNGSSAPTWINLSSIAAGRLADLGKHSETASSDIVPTDKFEGAYYKQGMFMTSTYNDSSTPCDYGNIINTLGGGGGLLLLGWEGSYKTGNLYYRSHRDMLGSGGWTPWKQIAYVDDIPTSLKNPDTLTLQAGTFSAKTYDGSNAVIVNIPTHTSHLINNSGFLTQHLSLANYVTTDTEQTITASKTFSQTSLRFLPNSSGGYAIGLGNWDTNGDNINKRTAGLGFFNSQGVFSNIYLGWGDTPWSAAYNVTISDSTFTYKNNEILHTGNSSVSGGGSSGGSSITVNIGGTSKTLTIPTIPTKTSHLTNDSGFLTLHLSLDGYVTKDTSQTITGLKTFECDSNTTGIALKLRNSAYSGGMSTAMDFYNGGYYTVPNARIETKMTSSGKSGGTLIFYTQTKHASANPNTNGLTERLRIDDNGTIKVTGTFTINREYPAISFIKSTTNTPYGWLGFSGENTPIMYESNGTTSHILMHDGNSSVSGGGSTWGSSMSVKLNNSSTSLTIPNIYWGIYEITVGNDVSFTKKGENHRFIASVDKSGNDAFINVAHPSGFNMDSTLISTMGTGSVLLWVHRTSHGSSSLLYSLRGTTGNAVTGSFLIQFLCIG